MCGLCFDNLRVLLACVCLLVCLGFLSVCSLPSNARPWLLIRELVVRWLAFLSPRGPASCLCSVLLCPSFLFFCICGVAACCFFCFVSLPCWRCSVELSVSLWWVCVGGSLFFRVSAYAFKRVCRHRRPPQHLAQLMHVSWCPVGLSCLGPCSLLLLLLTWLMPCVSRTCALHAMRASCGLRPPSYYLPLGIICFPAAACLAAQVVRPVAPIAFFPSSLLRRNGRGCSATQC